MAIMVTVWQETGRHGAGAVTELTSDPQAHTRKREKEKRRSGGEKGEES